MQFNITQKNKHVDKDAIIKEHVDIVVKESKKSFEILASKVSIAQDVHDKLVEKIEKKTEQHNDLLERVDKLTGIHNDKVTELHKVEKQIEEGKSILEKHDMATTRLVNVDILVSEGELELKKQQQNNLFAQQQLDLIDSNITSSAKDFSEKKRQFDTEIYNATQKLENIKKEIVSAQSSLGACRATQSKIEEKNSALADLHKTWSENLETIKKQVDESEKYKLNALTYSDNLTERSREAHDTLIAEAAKSNEEARYEMERLKDLKSATETKYKRFNLLRDKLIEDLIAMNIVNDNKDIKNLINQIRLI